MLYFTKYELRSDADWVTFVHGAGGSSSIWYKQIRDFRKHYNVLMVDLRGHGKSKTHIVKNLKRYTFDKIGDEVLEVLDHLNIERTHWVGISLGTIIIRELSERFPERSLSMIMGGAVMKLNLRGQILMKLGVLLKSAVPYLLLYKLFAWIMMPRRNHRESRNLFIKEAKQLYHKEFIRWFRLASEVNPLLKFFRFRDTGIPTLYIMGGEDYMFLPSIEKLVKDHQSSQLFIIPGCGHVVNVEQPKVFNQKALAFLRAQY